MPCPICYHKDVMQSTGLCAHCWARREQDKDGGFRDGLEAAARYHEEQAKILDIRAHARAQEHKRHAANIRAIPRNPCKAYEDQK